jgi:hypothetical protein
VCGEGRCAILFFMHERFYYRWKSGDDEWRRFSTGVSLHGHTWHSHESLAFLPATVQKMYFLPRILQWAENRYHRKWRADFDYSLGYWTSPVSPKAAYQLEAAQITSQGLRPLVSLTDHDSVLAYKEIVPATPLSLEWTAPYNSAVFHIGVHNLPAREHSAVVALLAAYTENPDPEKLGEILATLAAIPDTLIILNHPLSDQGRIGFEIHATVVREFLQHYGQWIHALEVNAMQSWDINRRVAAIAREQNFPIIAGGDRHGFEPNGAINLTNAKTFADFVAEVRGDKQSQILFMPQVRRSLKLRYAENVKAIMDDYPELPGRVFWHDRVFYKCPDGITRSITEMSGAHPETAFGTMSMAVSALGLVNFIARPIAPVFTETDREI